MLFSETDLVMRFCKDVEARSQTGYVDFGRFAASHDFVAGSGHVNFVQNFYNGDLRGCEYSFDKMGRTAQLNIICGGCLNGVCKGDLGCICNVAYDETKCRHGPRVFGGFTVGFNPRSWEVVYNGMTQMGFEKPHHQFSSKQRRGQPKATTMGSLTSSKLLLAAVLLFSALFAGGQLGPVEEGTIPDLQRGFYQNTCPQAEAIVKRTMMKNVLRDLDLPAGIIRLFFHDCFVRGCDASILLEKTPEGGEVEMESPANGRTLNGLEVINEAKAAIEAECPEIVSCADILAFAARDATVIAGLRTYPVAAGRRDGFTSRALDTVRLPSPGLNADQLIRAFASKGLTESDLVVLSGAHSIGGSTCQMFETRLYNFTGDAILETQDPSLDIVFAEQLKLRCPRNLLPLPLPQVGKVNKVPFEWVTSRRLDTAYYTELMKGRGLLTTDQTLMEDARTSSIVRQIMEHPRSWPYQFRKAMMKLGGVDVLLGNHGEIRRDCRFVNAE